MQPLRDAFTHVSIPMQSEGNDSNYTIRASKTDIFFSEGVQWIFLPDADFRDVNTVNESEMSNSTEDRLEWYAMTLQRTE